MGNFLGKKGELREAIKWEQTKLNLDDDSDDPDSPVKKSVKRKVKQFFRKENKDRRDSRFKRCNKAFGTLTSAELVN